MEETIKEMLHTVGYLTTAYVAGNYLIFSQVGAKSYWEATGYINGMVRGAGNAVSAQTSLDNWKAYWQTQGAWSFILNHLYSYGIGRINDYY